MTIADWLFSLDLFGTTLFAVSGALLAGRKRMDLFGMLVVAAVTAMGGGTVRDLLLGVRPVFWVTQPVYLAFALGGGLLTCALLRLRFWPDRWLLWLWADALGLAVFTVIGCDKAHAMQVHGFVVVLMGMITGVVGGMIRDLLVGEVPLILQKEVYATASIVAGVVYVIMTNQAVPQPWITLATAATVLTIRLTAIRYRLSLPVPADKKN